MNVTSIIKVAQKQKVGSSLIGGETWGKYEQNKEEMFQVKNTNEWRKGLVKACGRFWKKKGAEFTKAKTWGMGENKRSRCLNISGWVCRSPLLSSLDFTQQARSHHKMVLIREKSHCIFVSER